MFEFKRQFKELTRLRKEVGDSYAGNAAGRDREHGASESSSSGADPRPRCASVGDPEKPVWLCHECASHLCHPQPRMPPKALANLDWGGREHALYQNLTMSTRTLLGLGRLVMRLVLLKP